MSTVEATGSFIAIDPVAFIERLVVPGLLEAADKAGGLVAEEARSLVPVDTGELRDSIGHSTENEAGAVIATVFAGTDHASYVEFGTGIRGKASAGAGPYPYSQTWPGMPAQPYMRPALDTTHDDIKAAFISLGGEFL